MFNTVHTMMSAVILGQVKEGIEQFNRTATEFGIITALFVALIVALVWGSYHFGTRFIKATETNFDRIATSVEAMADAFEDQAQYTKQIQGHVDSLESLMDKKRLALLALAEGLREAEKEHTEEAIRLMNQAKSILMGISPETER